MTKTFNLGTVLSITTGRLLTDIGNVYDILNFVLNENLFTHQLPRASETVEPLLLKQFPDLAKVNGDEVTTENWKDWLNSQIAIYGDSFEVSPITSQAKELVYESKDPITELVEMRDGRTDGIIVVDS